MKSRAPRCPPRSFSTSAWVCSTRPGLRPASVTAAELKAELLRFAQRASGKETPATKRTLAAVEFPADFSPDADAVLLGSKTLLTEADSFSFSCTGCGACCRGFSDTVLVDPADLFAMARAASPSSLPSQNPGAFRQQTGFFHVSALPRGTQTLSLAQPFLPRERLLESSSVVKVGLETFEYGPGAASRMGFIVPTSEQGKDDEEVDGRDDGNDEDDGFGPGVGSSELEVQPQLKGGFVPILYLRSKSVSKETKLSDDNSDKANTAVASAAATGAAGRGGRAAKGRRTRGSAASTGSVVVVKASSDPIITIADDGDRICSFAVPGKRAASVGGGKGLQCSLGPLGMPYTCALYPLGDFWSRAIVVKQPPHQQDFFALDHKRCEGVKSVGESSTASPTTASYRAAPHRRLGKRKERSEWFRRLATTVAALQFDQRFATAFDTARERWVELQAARRVLENDENHQLERDDDDDPSASASSLLSQSDSRCGPLIQNAVRRYLHDSSTKDSVNSSGSFLLLSPDDASAFVNSLLAECWYFSASPLPLTTQAGKEQKPDEDEEEEKAWEAWKSGIEKSTADVLWFLQSAIAELMRLEAAWESTRLRIVLRSESAVAALPPKNKGEETQEKVEEAPQPPSSSSSSTMSMSSRGRARGGRRALSSSSSSALLFSSSALETRTGAPARRPPLPLPYLFAHKVKSSFLREEDSSWVRTREGRDGRARAFRDAADLEFARTLGRRLGIE